MIDTAALRKLRAATTQGEWGTNYDFDQDSDQRPYPQWPIGIMAEQEDANGKTAERWVFQAWVKSLPTEADCTFVVEAHTAMPALLDELDRLRAFVAEHGIGNWPEPYEHIDTCLGCQANTSEPPYTITHAPGCIVAEAIAAHRAS